MPGSMISNPRPPGVEEALLGFDARELFLDPRRQWSDERRRTYLLRDAVQRPLSVDTAVWPSLFGEGLPAPEHQRLRLEQMQLPDWKGPNPGLWDDLSRLQGSLGRLALEPHGIVAVSWVSENGFLQPSASTGPYRELMTPAAVGANWTLLGFDVADAGFISGLSNCGYDPSERTELRATWGAHLNEHHLFTDVNKALAFRDLTDKCVPEHAPFFVYALSLAPPQAVTLLNETPRGVHGRAGEP